MGRRQKRRQSMDWLDREKKWAKMERNQPRNMIISLVLFVIILLLVIYRKVTGA
ncbi:MAG: hypothetical protein ABFD18_03690 [Syntrophomonas sp.]